MEGEQPGPPPDFPHEPVPPELLEWAREWALRIFDEEEFLAELREMEATGGCALEDFIDEIEAIANGEPR